MYTVAYAAVILFILVLKSLSLKIYNQMKVH